MGEVVNVLVAFAVIIFLFRWVTSGTGSQLCSRNTALTVSPHRLTSTFIPGNTSNDPSRPRSPAEVLGFRPKNVTQDMVRTPPGWSIGRICRNHFFKRHRSTRGTWAYFGLADRLSLP